MTKYVNAQTSVPYWLMVELHQVALRRYTRLNKMYILMLKSFLAYKPWEANPPLPWRVAKAHGTFSHTVGNPSVSGWVPMNMLLPSEMVDEIKHTIEVINYIVPDHKLERRLSLRSFLYTAVVWWYRDVLNLKGPGVIDG
jgi:hypothetical protein